MWRIVDVLSPLELDKARYTTLDDLEQYLAAEGPFPNEEHVRSAVLDFALSLPSSLSQSELLALVLSYSSVEDLYSVLVDDVVEDLAARLDTSAYIGGCRV